MTEQMTEPSAAEIVKNLRLAKQDECDARSRRVELEEQLVSVLGAREEGSETHDVGDCRVTITGKLSWSVDWARLDELVDPEWQPVRWKRELDVKKLRALRDGQHTEILDIFYECATTKPAKTSVVIKEKK